MKTHALTQGSPEWHAYRAQHFNASDAPAMLGVSPYKTRDQLLHELHTGMSPEVDPQTQRRFDAGHAAEAAARPLAEEILGEDLYPVTGSIGELSASFDGLTMDERIVWEHKLMNADLAESLANGVIPDSYHPQLEQQLLVSGAEKALFMATSADKTAMGHAWYTSNPDLRAKIIAGWEQFAKDLVAYVPAATVIEAVGRAPETLPALHIEVTGMVTASNIAEFKATALAAIKSVNRDLKTDQDFADNTKAIKWCADIESRVKAAKEHAMGQTASIDELFLAMDEISDEARAVRLELEKLDKVRKEELRTSIVKDARAALLLHVAELNIRIGKAYMPTVQADFAGSIKGKKSLDSMRSAVSTVLANARIEANDIAKNIETNLRYVLDHSTVPLSLLPDIATICLKAVDDFQNTVTARLTHHEAQEAERKAKEIKDAADLEVSETARLAALNTTLIHEVPVSASLVSTIAKNPPLSVTTTSAMPVPISKIRKELNEHLETLSDDDLERVLRFCQSRYPLQAKAA